MPYLLKGIDLDDLPEYNKFSQSPSSASRDHLVRALLEMLYHKYNGRKALIQHIDNWIKFVSLFTYQEHNSEIKSYKELLFFLFMFKEVSQFSNKRADTIEELSDLIYHCFGRRQLIAETEKWAWFVAFCTEKEHHVGSAEYLELLRFFLVLKEGLLRKESWPG